jgi:hypothetical protein
MSSSSDNIFGIGTTQVVIAPGGSFAQYINMGPRVTSLLVKYASGGTLEIQAAYLGTTMLGASLTAAAGTGYIFAGATTGQFGEALSLDGPARFYLIAGGSTTTAMILAGITQPGYNNLGS